MGLRRHPRDHTGGVLTARVDRLLPKVAARLDLEMVGPLGGGEFGAALVRDRDGQELVLKALAGAEWESRFAQGAALSGRVRSVEYPVPRYVGTGVVEDASWSLQEVLPGDIPDVMTQAHARQLLGFARRHADAAGRKDDWVVTRLPQELGDGAARLCDRKDTAALGRDLRAVMSTADEVEVRTGDVVHADFHHRNFLAVGDEVTGVFDWELAYVGDWRMDLMNLACWGSWVPWQIPPAVASVVVDEARAQCPAPVFALFTTIHTLRAVDFNVRVHPDRLPWMLETIDATTRSWLHPS